MQFENLFLGAAFLFFGLAVPTRRGRRRVLNRNTLFGFAAISLLFCFYIKLQLKILSPLMKRKTFVLAGQSNMAGRGGIVRKIDVKKVWDPNVLTPKEKQLTIPDGQVTRLTADLKWVPAVEPLHKDIDYNKSCGIGPGLVFARKLGEPVRLIPCAIGGTKISEWSRTGNLYTNMLKRIHFAGEEVEALLWYQGESDSIILEDALSYKFKLEEFIRNVRNDLSPNILIIMVAIWTPKREVLPHNEHVRAAIFEVAKRDSRIKVVDVKGSSFLDDNLHLTSDSQFKLGDEMYMAYQNSLLQG